MLLPFWCVSRRFTVKWRRRCTACFARGCCFRPGWSTHGQTDAALLKQGDEVLARFHHGESFADLAMQLSVDARHTRGGDWGWIKESDAKPEYWASIRDLPKGQAAAPILLPEGAFLLYVDDRG